jgi:RNA recognition motif-containing protein
MAAWLFIDGFPRSVTTKRLVEVFSPFGHVRVAHIIRPSRRNFGPVAFIDMTTDEAAYRAMNILDGSSIEGQLLRIVVIDRKTET